MSLPGLFGTTLETIPCVVPYLHAEPSRVRHWRGVLAPHNGITVGICWRGNPQHYDDRNRSMNLDYFTSLTQIPGVRLISLQKPVNEPDTARLASLGIANIGVRMDPGIDQFIDTAAVIKNLDLVITIDSAVAHLAGALGKPVWVLLPLVPDWRWLLDRDDSPWYPSMRLFRQTQQTDWTEVIARVSEALRVEYMS